MKRRIMSGFLAMAMLLCMLPQMAVWAKATESQKGDGWGNWSDYVLEDTVVIYPVEGGNVYFGQMNPEWVSVDQTQIELLGADSTVTRAVIPETINGFTVASISEYCFGSDNLEVVHLPSTIDSVWGTSFMGCTNLKEIHIAEGNSNSYVLDGILYTKSYNSWTNSDVISLEYYIGTKENEEFAIPRGVTSIAHMAFCDASHLRSISIPSTITSIQSNAMGDEYCNLNFTDIYYEGSEDQWQDILVGGEYGYDTIESALIHFNRYEPFQEVTGGDLSWNTLYYNYIMEDKNSADYPDGWEYVDYELIYLDNDNIPELWITYQSWASGGRLVSIKDGAISQTILSMGALTYSEYSNVFYHSGGKMDHYFDTVYKLEDGSLTTIAEGKSIVTWHDDRVTSDTQYYWNDSVVTEQIYSNNLNELVNETSSKETSSEESTQYSYDEVLDYLQNVTEDALVENALVIYSDYSNLSIREGSAITLTVGILADGKLSDDVSGINFQIEDSSILAMSTTGVKGNYRYVKLKGITEGTTTVVFTDSNTGYTAKVPITVYDDNYLSYTLSSVPTQYIEKYPTNIYNANGLYVDSYKSTVNDDQSATVSFDVYNTNYIYGAVEIYDENGNMIDAVLIEKMTSSNTSIKEALWDNIGYLVRDIVDGDLLSYRQESGYSKKTSVSVKIPKNGYIKITNDPENSLIVGLVNSVDGLMSMASLAGDIKNFDVNSKEFSKKLTKKLVTDKIYIELIKDGSKASKNLWKNVAKETFITAESMGSFTDTITKNIDQLKLGSIIADTAADFGWDIGENVFTYFTGPAGTALNIMFTIGKVENLIIQQNDLIQLAGVGAIYIQNQGGGFRACQQIKVESTNSLSSDTALDVFTVTLDSELLNIIKDVNPEAYEAMTVGITRTYNISLIKSGEETQPDGKVTVYIPISDDFKALAYAGDLTGKIKIYRVEEDGGLTEMDVEIDDGCFVFTTDHFSLYTIVGYDFPIAENQNDGKDDNVDDGIEDSKDEGKNIVPLIVGIVSAAVVIVGAFWIVVHKRKKKAT